MANILAKPKGEKFAINGKTYTLSPMSLYIWGEIEQEFPGQNMEEILGSINTSPGSILGKILYVLVKEAHPEIDSARKAGELIVNISQMEALIGKISSTFDFFVTENKDGGIKT